MKAREHATPVKRPATTARPPAQRATTVPPTLIPGRQRSALDRVVDLQRTAGNQAVVQLAKKAAAPVAVTPEELSSLTSSVAKAAHDIVGTPAAAGLFGVITAQVNRKKPRATAPKHKDTDPLAGLYTELYSKDTVALLARLSQAQRLEVVNGLLDALIPQLGAADKTTGAVTAPDAPIGNAAAAAAEEPSVSKQITNNCEGGWSHVRRTILATFGALEVGPDAAIGRANAFYDKMVRSELLGVKGSLVHPDMQAALDAASTWITSQPGVDVEAVKAGMGKPGGFWIRPNRNNPLALSEHSFGFAIDLNAPMNPNIGKKGGLDAVKDATGVDPATQEDDGLDAAGVQKVAATLHQASADYVAVMSEPARFTARVRQIADGVRAAEKLKNLDDTGADALSTVLRTGKGAAPPVDAVLTAAFGEVAATDAQKAAAATLVRLAKVWRLANPASGKRPKAATEGTVGSVAANGFLNLQPMLVGGLSGTNAGNLNWLGCSSVHDYMHFELMKGSKPALF
ncbi:hypothetical protein [Actinoplanes sp. NBRC 103695]|uniref:hypothetical protein n=1 Tax=Actinoplanes sp. NBRC 103695 TaxID=3032202 RepID=UPI0024A605F9|nr:hypothetical protein [Actinoplanes sp. NBRC 103695]GLY92769.1 hypothetical protein Acsp02_00250 [Actinoplanes sp. NBRC 103695]